VIAVDTNLLVYAHRRDSPHYPAAVKVVRALAESTEPWAIPWPCVHEFLAIATHPRIYDPPSTMTQALTQVDAWFESPSLVVLGEQLGHWGHLTAALLGGEVVGPRVHDARIAALCVGHGVRELWSADRDFRRFPGVTTRNPLVA
jgi:toxin-antitoxin system PIN domain toxin